MKPSNVNDSGNYSRRQFLKRGGSALAGLTFTGSMLSDTFSMVNSPVIEDVIIEKGVMIQASGGVTGFYKGSSRQDLETLKTHLPVIKALFLGKDPLDRSLEA